MATKNKGKSKKKQQNKSNAKPLLSDTATQCVPPCLFGLSIGSQNICLAVAKGDTFEIVVNETGDRLTPLCIYYEQQTGGKGILKPLIGQVASQSADRGLSNCFTHLLNFERMCENVSKQNRTETSDRVSVISDSGSHQIQHVRILKDFLSAARDLVSAHSNRTASHCIIAHSSHVSMDTIETLRDACSQASLVPIQIVSSGECALLAYGVGQNMNELNISRVAIVIDLGHNYLDVSIYRIIGGIFQPIKSVQFPDLGGQRLNELLSEHVVTIFSNKYKCNIRDSKKSILKINTEVSNVKHVLSSLASAPISIDSLFDGIDCHLSVSRGRFESLISPLIGQTMEIINSTLKDANLEPKNVTDVVCVGGSCRIPFVQSQLQGSFPSATLHATLPPDEVAALGAVKQCHLLESKKLVSEMPPMPHSIHTTSHSITLKIDSEIILFETGMPLPATKTDTFEVSTPQLAFSLFENSDRQIGSEAINIPEGVTNVSLQSELTINSGLKLSFSDTASGQSIDTFHIPFSL